jgi:hypothetical protein
VGGNRSTRGKPTTFGRALLLLFSHEDWVRVALRKFSLRLEHAASEVKGKCANHLATEAPLYCYSNEFLWLSVGRKDPWDFLCVCPQGTCKKQLLNLFSLPQQGSPQLLCFLSARGEDKLILTCKIQSYLL